MVYYIKIDNINVLSQNYCFTKTISILLGNENNSVVYYLEQLNVTESFK